MPMTKGMAGEMNAQPKKKVVHKNPSKPKTMEAETVEPTLEKSVMKPTQYSGQRKIGAEDNFVDSVGLGSLRVITNGETVKYQ